MNKPTLSKIISTLLTAAVALAVVCGYDVLVVQPRNVSQPATPTTRGVTHYSELQADTITATTDLISEGAASVAGAITAASVNASGPITSTGNLTVHTNDTIEMHDPDLNHTGLGLYLDFNTGKMGLYNWEEEEWVFYYNTDTESMYSTLRLIQPVRVEGNTGTVTLADAHRDKILINSMAAPVTYTLPAANQQRYCFAVTTNTHNLVIDPPAGATILGLTDAAGDSITANTVGSSLCLAARDSVSWLPMGVYGAWTDTD